MPGRAWPLVLFTILTQMAAGMVLALAALHLLASRSGAPTSLAGLTGAALVAVPVLLAAGALAAAFHLPRPAGLHRTLANLRASWLSREALAGLVFGLLSLLLGVANWWGLGPEGWRDVALLLAAGAGVALVYVVARLYRLRTVPAWDSPATPVSFFATALLLGGTALLATWVLVVPAAGAANLGRALRSAVPLASGLLVAQLALLLGQGSRDARVGRALSRRLPLVGCRFALAGVALVLIRVAAAAAPSGAVAGALVLVASAFVLASEVTGRFLFYSLYERVGL